MAKLIYAAIASLDGYVADHDGRFDWSAPDEEVHAAVNDVMRPLGTQLLGRRMYEVLAAWDTLDVADGPDAVRDYAEMWRGSDKVVYSRTLAGVDAPRTTLERAFDADDVRERKAAADRDLGIGGPHLAAEALRAGLVDELHLFLHPIVVGGGTAALPGDVALRLSLLGERRFTGGVVHLSYRVDG
jgi:dihydrofolate reductase